MMKTLLYILHSGQRYGTERMALATLAQLRSHAETVLFSPKGPVQQLAAQQHIHCHAFGNKLQLACQLWHYLGRSKLSICTTGVSQALIVCVLALLRGKWPEQIHVVHGGTDEKLSYGRKHWLQLLGIKLVAVSAFVKARLLAHGCKPEGITTIENFLITRQSQRAPFTQAGIQRICMMTRIDPIKQVGVAISAWQKQATLPELLICGTGWQSKELQSQSTHLPQIKWLGFVEYPSKILTSCDLYIHTCDNEPFGLAILEAMDAGVPVLVPDQGGAAALVQNGITGFYYRAGDSADLAWQITRIAHLPASTLNQIVAAARLQLNQRFSATARIADYARLCGISGGQA